MQYDIFFWWSVISTLIGVILLIVSVWQYLSARNSDERKRAQVKIWMQDANGVQLGLQRMIQDNLASRYTSTNDMANSAWTLHASAFALYQSLYEERCVTEDEYKKQQQEFMNEIKKNQNNANSAPLPDKKQLARNKVKN